MYQAYELLAILCVLLIGYCIIWCVCGVYVCVWWMFLLLSLCEVLRE